MFGRIRVVGTGLRKVDGPRFPCRQGGRFEFQRRRMFHENHKRRSKTYQCVCGGVSIVAAHRGALFQRCHANEYPLIQARWLIGQANTPAQHAQLAAYYRKEAEHCLKEAKEHNEMAASYPKLNVDKHPSPGNIAVVMNGGGHCRYWAGVLTKRARQDEALATAQKRMAQETTTNK